MTTAITADAPPELVRAALGEGDPEAIWRSLRYPCPLRLAPAADVPIVPVISIGATPDIDAVYASITALMQRTLDEPAAERRWPVIG